MHRWTAAVAAAALAPVAGCSADDPAVPQPQPQPQRLERPTTGAAGGEQLAEQVRRQVARDNPRSDDPRVRCDPLPDLAAGTQVDCELRLGDGPVNPLLVVLQDDAGTFRYGPSPTPSP